MSNSVWPHRWQSTRLPHPWDSPGKNTGVGCYFLLQCMKVKSESEVAQSCPTVWDPMDCSLPGSSVHGIFQARVLEWGAIAFSDVAVQLINNVVLASDVQQSDSFIYICMYLKVKVKVAQMCLTLWDPMDYTVHGILQARILEWVAFPFSRGSSQPRNFSNSFPI